jgi:hypothetical protein
MQLAEKVGVLRKSMVLRRAIESLALLAALSSAATAQTTYPLIGVTGDGNVAAPESLFLLDPTNASAMFVMALGNGADGETIAFDPDDGLLYHASGVMNGDRFWESVDVLAQSVVFSGQFTGPAVSASHETVSMTYDPATQRFLVADRNWTLFDTTLTGDATAVSALSGLPGTLKGLAFAAGSLWGGHFNVNTLYRLDPSNGVVLDTVNVTLGGNDIDGMNGLTTHPVTGELWGIFRIGDGPGVRHLGTIDPITGVVTSVGVLAHSFAGIAFLPEPSSSTALGAGAIAVALCAIRRNWR